MSVLLSIGRRSLGVPEEVIKIYVGGCRLQFVLRVANKLLHLLLRLRKQWKYYRSKRVYEIPKY